MNCGLSFRAVGVLCWPAAAMFADPSIFDFEPEESSSGAQENEGIGIGDLDNSNSISSMTYDQIVTFVNGKQVITDLNNWGLGRRVQKGFQN